MRAGYFTKEAEVRGSWSWTNGDEVRIFTKRIGAEVCIEMSYTWTHPLTGVPEDVRQRIDMVSKPSNLGKGTVLYFRCPSTGRPCRILYRAYHARTFRSRWGFSYRLYYPAQLCGKLGRWDEVYWNAERHLERGKGKRNPGTYLGKPTKRAKRVERLWEQMERADEIRWSPACWPVRLRGAFKELL